MIHPSKFLVLTFVVATIAGQAAAAPIVSSTGLVAPTGTVTFSELAIAPNTLITNQFQAFGVTLSPGHHYNSQGPSPFPGITGDYVGVSNGVPFSILFQTDVTAAVFGYAKNPTTVLVEALLNGVVIESFSQAVTYNNPNTAFLGFTGITFDEIRVTANVSEGLIDNIQFQTAAAVPEPASMLAWGLIVGVGAVGYRLRKRTAAVA